MAGVRNICEFVQKTLAIPTRLLYNSQRNKFHITHQERWREWPCEVAATIAA